MGVKMQESITINLPKEIQSELDNLTDKEGISYEELISEAIKEYIYFHSLRSLRERMIAKAQMQGINTDQDIFDRISWKSYLIPIS